MKLLAVAALLSTSVVALETLVDVSYTKYQGTALPNGITQWLGIRYAAPPLGALRFEPPQDPLQNKTIQLADQVSVRSRTTNENCLRSAI
jgi:carboxylesterase type B